MLVVFTEWNWRQTAEVEEKKKKREEEEKLLWVVMTTSQCSLVSPVMCGAKMFLGRISTDSELVSL